MNISTETIDQIVANVLGQLNAGDRGVATVDKRTEKLDRSESCKELRVQLVDSVITGELLEAIEIGAAVALLPKAIITPAAKDVAKERRLTILRNEVKQPRNPSGRETAGSIESALAIVVQHTDAVQQAVAELANVTKELKGCPDDAAQLAISEICRGGANTALIFADQTFRVTCLANRNPKIKAAMVNDSGDVKTVRKQLRANVWCINPMNRSYFELKNLLKSILT